MKASAIADFLALAALFFGGAIFGLLLSWILAPEFPLALWLGLLSLPLALIIGAHLWLGFAMLSGSARLLYGAARGRGQPPAAAIPPGSLAFALSALGVSSLAGFILALAPNRLGFLPTLLAFVLLGALYGIICHRLARKGYLPVYDLEGEP